MNGKFWVIFCSAIILASGIACNRNTTENIRDNSNSGQTIIDADVRILFIGNSHTSVNNIPGLVKQFIEGDAESKSVAYRINGAPFLETVAKSQQLMSSIKNGKWDFVVLQGQKISTSGKYYYSTDPAKKISKAASQSGAKVILFAEWGIRGVEGDGERIQKIYEEIQAAGNSIVAPIGRVWDAALAQDPDLKLHAKDGNHSNFTGAWLAAVTLYAMITERDCRALPNFESDKITNEQQRQFKDIAWSVVDPYLANISKKSNQR